MIPIQKSQQLSVLDSLDHLGWSATPSEVAVHSGLPLDLVTKQLNDLGTEANATVTVIKHSEKSVRFRNSEAKHQAQHELVYEFPENTRSILRSKSWRIWGIEILFKKVVPAAYFCFQVGFLVSLVISIVIVTVAIIAVLSRQNKRGGGRSSTSIFTDSSGRPGPGGPGPGPGRYPRGHWHFHDYYWFSRMLEDLILGPRYLRYRRLRVQQVEDGNRVDFSKASDSWFNFGGSGDNSSQPNADNDPDAEPLLPRRDPSDPDDPETGNSSFGDTNPDRRRRRAKKLNWFEALISFVFGDEDPNEDLSKRRFNSLASYIRAHGGCIAAIEIPAFFDGEKLGCSVEEQTKVALPVVQHFGGVIHSVDDEHFVFLFPKLVPTDREDYPNFLQEEPREFTYATPEQLKYIVGFGGFNLALYILYPIIRLFAAEDAFDHRKGDLFIFTWCLNFADQWYWLLLFYATCYFTMPSLRFYWLKAENERILKRNEKRIFAAKYSYDCKIKKLKDETYEFHYECMQLARSMRSTIDATESSVIYQTKTSRIGDETHHFLELQRDA